MDNADDTEATTAEEFVRYIHPEEWAVVISACLEAAGWAVEITPDGGIQFPQVTPQQSTEMEAAADLCRRMYPVDPRFRQPLTTAQLEYLYDWYVKEGIPCLEAQGYSGFDPPSLDSFIESYGTEDTWSPYRDISTELQQLPAGGWYALNEDCPQNPPVNDLFGS